jgi:hypothetical protein
MNLQEAFREPSKAFRGIQGAFRSLQGTFRSLQGAFMNLQEPSGAFREPSGAFMNLQEPSGSLQGAFRSLHEPSGRWCVCMCAIDQGAGHQLGFDCGENQVDRFVEIGMTLSRLACIWSKCLRGKGAYARKDGIVQVFRRSKSEWNGAGQADSDTEWFKGDLPFIFKWKAQAVRKNAPPPPPRALSH